MDYKDLKELLIKASDAYYKNNNPIMTDYEFDMKLKELENMESKQGYRDVDSPTTVPGSDLIDSDNSNEHKRPMLSLENTYNFDEVEKWYNDMIEATADPAPEVVVEPKYDGNSAAIRYDNSGHVYKALTRGTGTRGEDITQNIKYSDDNVWPIKHSYASPFYGEARGEIIMTKDGFNELNKDGKYQNARNLVAGSLKLLDIYEYIPRSPYIKFYAYWLEDSGFGKYTEDLTVLKLNNFTVGPYYICKNINEIKVAINNIENAKLDVAIDGAVLKLNNKAYWNKLGSTAKFPRWAKAYKYKQESVETTINNIEFWVGRTGKITPVAWFDPMFIDGSTVQKATLNNKDFYETMNVAISDTVEVQKAAAIIPQIIDVVKRPNYRKVIPFPTACPCCGSTLVKHNIEQTDWFCNNNSCKSRIVDQIINYTHAIECDGFAEIIVERLHNAGLLNSISDLYRLKNHITEMGELERLSENLAKKLCKNIEDTKSAEFWKVLSGLGIPNVGPKTAKILSKKFKNIDNLKAATIIELEDTEDISTIIATGIVNWFNNNSELINALKTAGVNFEENKLLKENQQEINLGGKAFCITGALTLKRDTYVELIESLGGKVVGAVSSKTNYLITNDKDSGSSKNKRAQELGISILNEKELLEMCNALELLK